MSRRQPLTTCTPAPTPFRALLLHAWAFYRDNLADENVALPVLLADLGLETGGIQKLVAEGMELHAPYDPDQELLTLGTGERSQHRFLLDDVSEGAVGLSADYRVVYLGISNRMLPLREPHYDAATDVLSLRDPSRGLETPTHVTENGPLVGYFAQASHDEDEYELVGFEVRAASRWFNAIGASARPSGSTPDPEWEALQRASLRSAPLPFAVMTSCCSQLLLLFYARDGGGDDVVREQMKADPGQAWSQASTCRYRHRRSNMGREKQAAYHCPVMAESAPRPGHHRSPAECLSDHNRSPPRSF